MAWGAAGGMAIVIVFAKICGREAFMNTLFLTYSLFYSN